MRNARVLSAIVCIGFLFALSEASDAQSIDLSLNLQDTVPADPSMGGNWMLVGKTNSVNGISSINAIMSNVNVAGIAYQSGIGAMTTSGSPFVVNNVGSVELLYAQDLSIPASVVTDVGRGAGTPGNLAMDPFGDPNWNNAAVIATGTFGANKPAFTANSDTPPDITAGNVLGTKTAPFFSTAAAVTMIVRDSITVPLTGDYNGNGAVDAADYVVWRDTLGLPVAPSSGADGNGNGTIDDGDYAVWRANFGQAGGGGAVAAALVLSGSSVPEPSTCFSFIGFAVVAMLNLRRR
jgi:hypothetical protein